MTHTKLPHLDRYVDRLNPTQRYLVTEFVDNYEDGVMSRRDLIERVYRITGSVAAAAGTLLALGCAPATATPPPPTPTTAPTAAPTTVLDRVLNPRASAEHRRFVPIVVDLSAWAGRTVRLTLATDPRDETSFDWAGFANPAIAVLDTARDPLSRPTAR